MNLCVSSVRTSIVELCFGDRWDKIGCQQLPLFVWFCEIKNQTKKKRDSILSHQTCVIVGGFEVCWIVVIVVAVKCVVIVVKGVFVFVFVLW